MWRGGMIWQPRMVKVLTQRFKQEEVEGFRVERNRGNVEGNLYLYWGVDKVIKEFEKSFKMIVGREWEGGGEGEGRRDVVD